MEFASNGTRRAFIDYAFDLSGVGAIYVYPWSLRGFENGGKQPETVSCMLTYIRIPKYGYLPVAIVPFQNIFIIYKNNTDAKKAVRISIG